MSKFLSIILLPVLLGSGFTFNSTKHEMLKLHTRYMIQTEDGKWESRFRDVNWKADETAVIICDMWNQHWCKGATKRVAEIAPKMNKVISEARKLGVTIIHAPSETMDFYKDYPQRKKMINAPYSKPPVSIPDWCSIDPIKEAPLPIDDSDGGCDDTPQCEQGNPWFREISTLEIAPGDGISDNGQEIYNYFAEKGIKNVVLMGVHLNMCVIGRSFGVRSQLMQGKNVVIARDLTDAMYNHRMPPFVSHWEGVKLVVRHIEKYLCPSILGDDLTKGYENLKPTEYVQAPVIKPSGGVYYNSGLKISISSNTNGAVIRYTTDGSTPDQNAPEYKGSFDYDRNGTIAAVAFKKGSVPSPIATELYTFIDKMKNGLSYKYYEGEWKKVPDFDKIQPLKVGTTAVLDPSKLKLREDHFGIEYSSYINITDPAEYTFYLTSDDGSKFFIDGNQVVDNDGSHSAITREGKVKLSKGVHSIKILYFDDYDDEALSISLKKPGGRITQLTEGMMYLHKNLK